MNLYLVHCGFYDPEICDGIYESHVNFFVVAESFEEARKKVKEISSVRNKKMHVDGVQQIDAVDGYRICLEPEGDLQGASRLISQRHRDLAVKSSRS